MSSDSESDDLYVPGEPEKLSEEESGDDETGEHAEEEDTIKSKKRKSKQPAKGRKKIKTKYNKEVVTSEEEDEKEEEKVILDPEEIKKKEDDLWAQFLGKTDSVPKPVKETNNINNSKPKTIPEPTKNTVQKKEANLDADREKRIFEFAGETIVVENNVIKEKIKTTEGAANASKSQGPSRSSGGLSNILGQLNKKNNLSTLEKSKLDWNTYKKDEGIEEEITSHNKGKAGYLERRDFLDRTDVRQYEIERDLRLNKRSNR